MKYSVKKQTFNNEDIEDLGLMSIDEIKEFAVQYIGDCHKDLKDVEDDIKYIIENGEETWLTNEKINKERIQIRIEVKE
mgnify:CR=1 FL=1